MVPGWVGGSLGTGKLRVGWLEKLGELGKGPWSFSPGEVLESRVSGYVAVHSSLRFPQYLEEVSSFFILIYLCLIYV